MTEHTPITESDIDQIFDSIQDRVRDVQERQNRGALLVEMLEPLNDEEAPNRGDVIEVVASDGKLKHAEVISTNQIVAFHPEYGPVPCVEILAEITDPDRMTRDDFESLYGEKDTQEDTKELGSICECGVDRLDCQQNQELFGIHANASYEE
jgi:hypothetical protein